MSKKVDERRRQTISTKVLDALGRKPEGISKSEIHTDVLRSNYTAAQIDQVLSQLESSGMISSRNEKVEITRTVEVVIYILVAAAPPPTA